tara:strand:+ start:143 stop:697 length:555 start_codon:yes stop_codon:yes gene_type:complete
MPILKIAKIGHPILYQKALPIDKFDKNELKQLVANMCETMLDANGVGLAAPQVHVNKKLIIFRTPDVIEDESENQNKEEKLELNVLINPSYTNNSDDFEDDWEGCLSIPGMLGKVRRYKKITYRGYDLQGKLINKTVDGMHARIVQHECDHLNGILYLARLADPRDFGFTEEINKYYKVQNEKI